MLKVVFESNSRFYTTRLINKKQYIKISLSTIIQLNNMLGHLKKEHAMELGYQHKILFKFEFKFYYFSRISLYGQIDEQLDFEHLFNPEKDIVKNIMI
ncbi:hypothetical protein BpHYR1_030509 [Brachionus plicatilis]|uniref:Uncharacterized protein n=1 Tax=Brachionus plicatilis TaxID=10195 RepID=A0A3M7QG34_BRAPC|nr:hypothetical protein BpHYR1_030509 [Brachionus plicatilis]